MGVAARVVSMPSWELFEAQPRVYQEAVLPRDVWARVAIEAAHPQGWERYVGPWGVVIGVHRFGASAPYKVLMEKFGFTVENVLAHVQQVLEAAPMLRPALVYNDYLVRAALTDT